MRGTVLQAAWIGWLGCSVLGTSVAVAQDPRGEPEAATRTATVASFTIQGALPETAGQLGLFGEMESNLGELMRRLDDAAQDKSVSAVVLRIRNPAIGRGKVQELREGVKRLRQAGKRVVAELQMGLSADYLLACACDEIVMPESGTLMIPGVRAEVTFYKGLLDKLGIEADMMQVGDFKGSAEPYTRTTMSPESRQQYEMLLDDVYEQLVDTIAADRGLERDTVRELIDVGLFIPSAALEAGLIDRVSYEDQQLTTLKQSLGVDTLKVVANYGKKKVDSDFSGMLGMIKLFEMMFGGEPSQRTSPRKKIAVVYASGMIMPGKSATSLFGGQLVGSDTIVEAIQQARDDRTVVAIVLRVDSPGGSALASDLIWRAVRECDKPVIASLGDVAASGGYYVAMGCDQIFAQPGTLTGSIGVVGGKIALQGLYDKVGLSTETISRGQNSGILSFDQPFSESERAAWKTMMQEVYRQFVEKAAAGRGIPLEQMQQLAGGRVWTGRQAQQRGLVDQLGTLRDALEAAKKAAQLDEQEKTELLILPPPTSLFDQLLGGDASIHAPLDTALRDAAPELLRRVAAAEQLGVLFREPALYLMPYEVQIR